MSDNQGDVLVSFAVEGLNEELHVLSFDGAEALSELFRVDLDLACESGDLDFSEIIGEQGVLKLSCDGEDRYIHGIVAHLEQHESARRFTVYRATLVPRVWRLNHRHDCRIFQSQSMKATVSEVLDSHDIQHRWRCKGGQEPDKRDYCVQHRESDWNFICRLLEEEGYFYFFEHVEDGHELVISNDPQVHQEIEGESTVPYHGPDVMTPGEQHIFSFVYREQVLTGAVALADYNYSLPSLDYKAGEANQASEDGDLERYDYPGLYDQPEKGADVAAMRLEEQQAQRRGGSGRGTVTRFVPGSTFTMDKHPRDSFNMEYVITSLQHSGEKHLDLESGAVSNRCRYHNTFRCLDATVPYRPPRVTRRPFVLGPQTAVVVGPSGEEIYTDKLGRVKVQFHWDRLGASNEKSSCWVRVSQVWAGQGYGAMYIPRIGHEVIVDFVEGDADRPVIMGRVYHEQNVPPLDLPAKATQSTIKSNSSKGGGGYNEIRFEDNKGAEEFFTHAEKDQLEIVGNDHTTIVGNDQFRVIRSNRTAVVEEGDDTVEVRKGNRNTTVQGSATLTLEETDAETGALSGDRVVRVDGGSYDLEAVERVKVLGKEGVTVIGHDQGVAVTGTGNGVIIHATGRLLDLTSDGYDGGTISIAASKELVINVGGETGPTVTIDASGIKVNGAGLPVEIEGSVIKLNSW